MYKNRQRFFSGEKKVACEGIGFANSYLQKGISMELTVLYEDKDVVVFIKPYGIASEGKSPNITELLQKHWQKEDAYVGIVHRLDMTTAGVMVAAKNKQAAAELSKQITDGNFHKTYLAAVEGEPAERGEWTDYLFKDSRKNKVYPVKSARKGAKEAKLAYRVLDCVRTEKGARSLVQVELFTGRTHQIRVQFASRGYPLMGDGKYGSKDNRTKCALWSEKIQFKHWRTKENVVFSCEPEGYPWELFAEVKKETKNE